MTMVSFPWPYTRKEYNGVLNPRYVSDVRVCLEAVMDAIAAVTGMNGTDFAILSGLDYTAGSPNYYTPGIIYLNGQFYNVAAQFNENNYLVGASIDTQSALFPDGNSRNMYTEFSAQVSASSVTGATPQFTGNMNQYRIGLKYFQQVIIALQLATVLEVVTSNTDPRTTLGALYTVKFTNDQSIFVQSAPGNSTITFDFTNAVPGAVVRLQWGPWGSYALTVSQPAGSKIMLDSGDTSRAGTYTNVMYFAYAGKDASGNNVVSYTISQS